MVAEAQFPSASGGGTALWPCHRRLEHREIDDAGVRQAEAVGVEVVVDVDDSLLAPIPRMQGEQDDRADDLVVVPCPGFDPVGRVANWEVPMLVRLLGSPCSRRR